MSEEIKFEKAMEKLEKIVEDLEAGNISLEDALKKYEEGVKLSRVCQKRLSQAEKRIEILTRGLDGTLQKEPFEFEEEEVQEEKSLKTKRSNPKATSKENTGDEGDLLI